MTSRFLLSIAALFALVSFSAPAMAQTPTAADFAEPAFLNSPEMSPDGSKVAAVHHRDEGDLIAIIDTTDGNNVNVDLAPYDIYDLNWAGNGRLLVSVIADGRAFRQDVKMSRLIIYDLQTRAFMVADEKAQGISAGDVLWADREGRTALVSSQRSVYDTPMVRRIDLATGEAETVEKERRDVWNWYVDSRGVVRAGLAYDNKRYRIYYREGEGEDFELIRGKFDRDDEEDDGVVEHLYFGAARDDAMTMTNGPTGRFALYKYDLETEEIGAEVFAHDSADLDGVIRDSSGEVVGVHWHDTRQRIHWLEPGLAKIQSDLDKAFAGKVNLIRGFSDDRRKLLVRSGAADDPGRYFLVDLDARGAVPLFAPYSKVKAEALSPVKAVSYRASDGLDIPAYLTLPKDRDAKNLPLILLPHGGPFARDTWDYDPLLQYFASRGYAVFQPQFRGSTGYGRQFVEAGEGEWGRKMQDDLNDGLDWLASQGTIDPTRVCIVGISYGGYAAMWGAIRDAERFRCAASFAGVSDLPAMLKEDKGTFAAKRYYRNWRESVGGGLARKDLDIFSPVDHAEKLRVPLFLAHGEEDDNVPHSHSDDMMKALKKAGIEADYVLYEDIGHGIYYTDHFEDWLNRLGSFLAEHNPS